MAPFQPDPQLRQLLSALADDDLSPEDFEKLSELLEHNPQAQQYYVQYVSLHASLGWEIAQYTAQDVSPDLEENATALDVLAHIADYERSIPVATPRRDGQIEALRRQRTRRNIQRGSLAAALLVMVGLMGVILWSSNTTKPAAPVILPVAVLMESDDTTWLDEYGRVIFFGEGQPLNPQTLRLAQGLAKVRFNDGAVVVLDGRDRTVTFSLLGTGLGQLTTGQLTATVEMEQAKGFTIDLPGNRRVVDLGTEFGLSIDEAGHCDVFVFKGHVQAQRLNDQRQVIANVDLKENASLRLLIDGQMLAGSVARPEQFTSEANFDAMRQRTRTVARPSVKQGGKYMVPLRYIIPDEEGKPVTWYRRSYPDATGREMIDGEVGSSDHMDHRWMGWADGEAVDSPDSGLPQPRLEFEMDGSGKVDGIEIFYLISQRVGIYGPDRVMLVFSHDADFRIVERTASSTDFEIDQARPGVYRTVLRFPATDARHVRLDVLGDRPWIFLSEVRFLTATNP